MSGVQIVVEGLESVEVRIARLSSLDQALMLEAMGAVVESQTRRRLTDEKTSPDGAPWRPNRSGTPILVRSGHLLASIHYRTGASQVRVGSGLVYAAIHQFGGTIRPTAASHLVFQGATGGLVFARSVTMPARPYLGVSAENEVEIERVLLTAIGNLLN